MKTEIRYFTKSKKGNTRKLADVVSEALGIEAQDVSVDLPEKTDRLFFLPDFLPKAYCTKPAAAQGRAKCSTMGQ